MLVQSVVQSVVSGTMMAALLLGSITVSVADSLAMEWKELSEDSKYFGISTPIDSFRNSKKELIIWPIGEIRGKDLGFLHDFRGILGEWCNLCACSSRFRARRGFRGYGRCFGAELCVHVKGIGPKRDFRDIDGFLGAGFCYRVSGSDGIGGYQFHAKRAFRDYGAGLCETRDFRDCGGCFDAGLCFRDSN